MDNEQISEMFSSLGPVVIKRMFGGKGVYFGGRIVAVEVDDEILLKADAAAAEEFRQAGSRQWTYANAKTGKTAAMPYWSIPDAALDDADEMARWVGLAWDVARRAK